MIDEKLIRKILKLEKELDSAFFLDDIDSLEINHKSDRSLVTRVDKAVSHLVKLNCPPSWCFYSEEDHENLAYPAMILDPLDGTKEFASGRDDFAFSLSLMESNSFLTGDHWSWIYSPRNQLSVHSSNLENYYTKRSSSIKTILVSRTEYDLNLFKSLELMGYKVQPVGSIAYKLALLITGKADAVVTLKPKNIWDISAGTEMLYRLNGICLHQGREYKHITEVRLRPSLYWAFCFPPNDLLDFLKKEHR